MDAASPAAACRPLIRIAGALLLFSTSFLPGMQGQEAQDSRLSQIKQLVSEQRWQEAVALAESAPARSPDLDFYYGTALARLGRWDDAHRIFKAGYRLSPSDERFAVELAGVEFKQKRYAAAAAHLRRALKLVPGDTYANDFLASVYLLEGNQEAALQRWNREKKPRIAAVTPEPVPQIDPALLDRAFAFSPAATLLLPQLLTSEKRVQGLDIFSAYRFDLSARPDGAFDMLFYNKERNGWGNGKLGVLVQLFHDLPSEAVTPEYFNFHGQAINFSSSFRWDAQKRRILAGVSAPLRGNPKWRYRLGTDLRNENWNVLTSFAGAAQGLGSFNLRREAASAEVTSFASGRWSWTLGAELSHRDFRSVVPGPALNASLLSEGMQLKQRAQLNADLWRLPEKRMDFNAIVSSEAGHIWSQPAHAFLKLRGALLFHWFPLAQGDDYEMQQEIRAGKTFGDVPIDELFVFGQLGDNDLWMRGHSTTRDGRKGSGPMGTEYFLSNWELDKQIFQKAGATFKLGPFVDSGTIADESAALGSHKWLCDVGVQAKLRVFGVSVALIFGKDLRSGHHLLTTAAE